MTVLIAIHLPGQGCVMASDGRLTGPSYEIASDTAEKVFRHGNLLLGVAGDWEAMTRIRDTDPSVDELANMRRTGLSYELFVYDRSDDLLWYFDSDGSQEHEDEILFGGNGCSFAAGALDSFSPPGTLSEARSQALGAVRVSCKRHTQCGGRVRALTVRCR
jgi:20S proteasome alpha/beta subunit